MKAKLVNTLEGRVRFYKLSEIIRKGRSDVSGEVNIVEDTRKTVRYFHNEVRDFVLERLEGAEGVNLVAVSDATTHLERLVFPAFYKRPEDVRNGIDCFFTGNDIAGVHTMMNHGGDALTMLPDEEYLKQLCELNGLQWEGIEK